MESLFSARGDDEGGQTFDNKELIPANWYHRKSPYTDDDITTKMAAHHLKRLVWVSGDLGQGNFDVLEFSTVASGKLPTSTNDPLCLFHQFATEKLQVLVGAD